MKPTAGRVFFDGKDLTKLEGQELVEARRKTVSFIFQEGNLLPHLSALDNVIQPLRHQGIPAKEAHARASKMLERLEMAHRALALPDKLSGGEQQRVVIARALITEPRLVLADEPTGALDPVTTQTVLELFEQLHQEQSTAFLIVTHSESVAKSIADRSLELIDGRFVGQHGDNVDLYDLNQTRELIVDELGSVVFPPDVLLEIGGPGTFQIEENESGRIVLIRSDGNDYSRGERRFSPSCEACGYSYKEDAERSCPECGSERSVE